MQSLKQLKLLRLLERITLLFFIVGSGGLAVLYGLDKLVFNDLLAGGGILIVILILEFLVQSKFDALLAKTTYQSALVKSEAFDSLYERSPAAYLTIATKGQILIPNPAAVNLLQGELDSMGGLNFFDFVLEFAGEDPAIFQSKMAAGMTLKDVEVKLRTLQNQEIWVLLSVYRYQTEEDRLISLVDITEQKQVDTAKSEFVALATHQLRTPISAIRWNIELLQKNMREIKTEKQTRYLDKIERNTMRMIRLINDFLSVSKLEMGTFAAQDGDINLTNFFDSIADEFAEKITQKNLTLNRSDNPPGFVLKSDTRLLHIIVSNLMSNASKYSEPNGTLTFTYDVRDDFVEIVVGDDGIGIPEVELPKLFTKFYRATNAQAKQTEGTGLGLYIVKASVEQLGGTISVQSAENEGAKFVVQLPIR